MKYIIGLLMGFSLFFATSPVTSELISLASFSDDQVLTASADTLTGTGVTKNADAQTGGVVKSLKTIANMVTTIAIILSVISLVFGAIKLSFGGGNPQSRNLGIGAIICACIGAYVAFKAYDIVGWAVAI